MSELIVSTSLAVKYRPKLLSDLVGQDHIVTQINGMLTKRRFPSTILLSGSSGLGKTTTARIIARYVNCKNPGEDFAPCGECVNCTTTENHPDVIEINAADTRGIDDVRSLLQQSKFSPVMGSRRFFIIDEAQQLTAQAQQAMLKSLEEPTPHTIWIICSMSAEKLLPAIIGRCFKLEVKPIEPDLLVKRLYRIAKREKVDFKTDVKDGLKILKAIADLSDGRMRNSIQLLESVIYAVSSGDELDYNTVLTKFLATAEADLDKDAANVLMAMFNNDYKGLLNVAQGHENIRGVLYKMRFLIDYLLSKVVGKAKFTPYSGRYFADLQKQNEIKVSVGKLLAIQYTLIEVEFKMNSNVDERVAFGAILGNFMASKD